MVARDAHISTHTGLVMTGARPVWVTPEVHPTRDVGLGVRPEALAATLRAHPAARLVVLVSPTYASVCSDLPALVRVAHAPVPPSWSTRHGVLTCRSTRGCRPTRSRPVPTPW